MTAGPTCGSARNPHARWVLGCCCGLLLGAAATGRLAAAEGAGTIARLGNENVSVDEVRPWFDGLEPREREALRKDPTLLNQTVRAVLVRRALLTEALAKHWDQDPAVAARLEQLRRNAVVDAYLQSLAEPPAGYPDDAEVRKAYDDNQAALAVPEQIRLAQIFIASPKDADKAVAERAQARLKTVALKLRAKDADFAAVAKAYSEEAQSAARGGEIGWLAEAQIQPELRTPVASLEKGSWSDPIRLADGWHILAVLDKKPARTPAFEEAKPALARQMRVEKARANMQAYVAKLAQDTPISVNELALPDVLSRDK